MKKRTLIGEYNHHGYTIYDEQGRVIYSAGNHPNDSTQTLPITGSFCLPLHKIRSMSIKTGKEIAKEKGWTWEGTERVSNDNN